MKNPFEFERSRKELAEKLLKKRSEGGRLAAKEVLSEEKATEGYQKGKRLHHARNKLPRDMTEKAKEFKDIEDDPEVWEVNDISDRIPQQLKFYIDNQLLLPIARDNISKSGDHFSQVYTALDSERFYGIPSYSEFKEACEKFLDEITDGNFSSPHNLNHFIGWLRGGVKKGEPFDRYSAIEGGNWHGQKQDAFWMSAAGSGYVAALEKPVAILNPKTLVCRRFIESGLNPSALELVEKWRDVYKLSEEDAVRSLFLKGDSLSQFRQNDLHFQLANASDLAQTSTGQSWMDVTDMLVDLRVGKVWKRKQGQEEAEQVIEETASYRARWDEMRKGK